MSEDDFFRFVALLAIALFIASGALPLPPAARRVTRIGAVATLAVGLVAALWLLIGG